LEYAENELNLSKVQDDGATLRQHLESIEAQTGVTPDQLIPVEVEECVLYIWRWFLEMNARRTSNGFGSNPISEEALASWCKRRNIQLAEFEYQALDALEIMYLTNQQPKKVESE
jgi:hypothetical protein